MTEGMGMAMEALLRVPEFFSSISAFPRHIRTTALRARQTSSGS
jgi:hypothetical protein